MKTAAVTRQTLHLLSLNAIVEGDRLGSQADAMLEIGNGISDLKQEWNQITDESSLAMRSDLVVRGALPLRRICNCSRKSHAPSSNFCLAMQMSQRHTRRRYSQE